MILTLPDSEAHLEVLAAPAAHLLVVGAQLPEVRAVDGEQTARHRRGPGQVRGYKLDVPERTIEMVTKKFT